VYFLCVLEYSFCKHPFGCTEIPLLLGEAAATGDIINPMQLLAETAVRKAMH
jgi:aspartate/glutamate racemase